MAESRQEFFARIGRWEASGAAKRVGVGGSRCESNRPGWLRGVGRNSGPLRSAESTPVGQLWPEAHGAA